MMKMFKRTSGDEADVTLIIKLEDYVNLRDFSNANYKL